MGGKSTLMRETAVLAILAHVVRLNLGELSREMTRMCF